MLFGCLCCFIGLVAFRQAVQRCYLLLMREAYGWDVGMLAVGGFNGFLSGVSAMVYPLRDCLVVCSMLSN